jgi:lipopolysaccharide/colanic/teichoic acid biosynthesis glycosyltransferase
MKRTFDLLIAATGLVAVAPLLAGIAVCIWISDGAPVFYRQWRVGRDGRPFRIWKFRTMVRNADRLGGELTVGRDPRITRVGSWLRKTKLDELPQLWNVVTGEMSLVGPRPEVSSYVDQYTSEQRAVLRLTPGITDPASVQFFDESELLGTAESPEQVYVDVIMPEKIRLNLAYAQRASLRTDVGVILATIKRMAA